MDEGLAHLIGYGLLLLAACVLVFGLVAAVHVHDRLVRRREERRRADEACGLARALGAELRFMAVTLQSLAVMLDEMGGRDGPVPRVALWNLWQEVQRVFPRLGSHLGTIDADVVGKAIESHALFDSIGRVFHHFLNAKGDSVRAETVRSISGVCREGAEQCYQAAWLLDDFAARHVAITWRAARA